MKPIHWLLLIAVAFALGMYVQSKIQPLLALPSAVENLSARVGEAEQKLFEHESRWRWLNRIADMGRRCLPWFK